MTRAVVIFVLVVVALTAPFAAAGAALAYPSYAEEYRLGPGDGPQLSARLTAWEVGAGDAWNVVVGIWGGHQTLVPADPDDQGHQRHPAVGESRGEHYVAYEDDATGDADLYLCTIDVPSVPGSLPSASPIASGAGDQLDPALAGDIVVYEDHGRGNSDIALYDRSSGVTTYLTGNASVQADPSTDGRWVAWADRRNGNWDIYARDLKTGTVKRLTTNRSSQTAPEVGQGKVVYQDRRNGNWDIYECTLATGKERRLTTHKADQTAPCIDAQPQSGRTGTIVYVDARHDAGDIWVREGRTGVSRPVCTETGAQSEPRIRAERVVWSDARSGQSHVYDCEQLRFPSLSVPRGTITPPWNGTAKVRGILTADHPEGQVVRVSGYGPTRSVRVTLDAAYDGWYTTALSHIKRKVTVRVWYPGDADHLPAWGGTVTIKPTAILSRPKLRRTPGRPVPITLPDRCTVTGTLRPRHAAGSRAVTLVIYRMRPYHDWERYKTLRVKVSDAGSGSAYRVYVSLPRYYRQKWRVQAVHQDAAHAHSESAISNTIGT